MLLLKEKHRRRVERSAVFSVTINFRWLGHWHFITPRQAKKQGSSNCTEKLYRISSARSTREHVQTYRHSNREKHVQTFLTALLRTCVLIFRFIVDHFLRVNCASIVYTVPGLYFICLVLNWLSINSSFLSLILRHAIEIF